MHIQLSLVEIFISSLFSLKPRWTNLNSDRMMTLDGITKVITVILRGAWIPVSSFMSVHPIVWLKTTNVNLMVELAGKSEVPQSQLDSLWAAWISVPTFTAICLIVVEIFQSGAKCWTDHAASKAKDHVIGNNLQSAFWMEVQVLLSFSITFQIGCVFSQEYFSPSGFPLLDLWLAHC